MFSQEMSSLKFFSVEIQVLLFYDASLGTQTEDLTVYMSIAEGASLLIVLNSEDVCEIEQSSCSNTYYGSTSCCDAFTECTISNYLISEDEVNYVQLKYVHKENYPCIRLERESTTLTRDTFDAEAYAGINIREAPFKVKSIINVNEISTTSTVMEIQPLINTNTGAYLADDTLQATVVNTLIIQPKDRFGNAITDIFTLISKAIITDDDGNELSFASVLQRQRRQILRSWCSLGRQELPRDWT